MKVNSIHILPPFKLPPCIVSTQGSPGIKGIIVNFGPAMEIDGIGEMVCRSEAHISKGFRLPDISVRMISVLGILKIPVDIHPVGIVAGCTTNGSISSGIGPVGIIIRTDKDLAIVYEVGDFCIGSII